ncbi:hypothetical protein ACS0TY_022559 [Phlomoides rotata]
MGIKSGNEEGKPELATEICELSARAIACSNLHHPRTNKSPFINWYLVLRVDENADVYSIRKQFHKLALQLHPDKNKHFKAETAFKLVSEAYYCLSDTARRRAFDSKRRTTSCIKCNINTCPPTPTPYQESSKQSRTQRRIKDLRIKLMDEAIIIQKCLKPNAAAEPVTVNGTRRETPIFNPSDYQYKGYPHHRTINYNKLQEFRAAFEIKNRWMHNTASYESPVFEHRSGTSSFMSRCSSTR